MSPHGKQAPSAGFVDVPERLEGIPTEHPLGRPDNSAREGPDAEDNLCKVPLRGKGHFLVESFVADDLKYEVTDGKGRRITLHGKPCGRLAT